MGDSDKGRTRKKEVDRPITEGAGNTDCYSRRELRSIAYRKRDIIFGLSASAAQALGKGPHVGENAEAQSGS